MNRRDFLRGAVALAASGAAAGPAGAGDAPEKAGRLEPGMLDPYSIGVISDIHTGMPWARQEYRTGREYPWIPELQNALVKEILSLANPPANVIGLGDVSLAFSEPGDYELAAEVLKPLTDAGIKLTLAMGNHDLRSEFLKCFPGYDATTKVPGRFVSVVETPHVDFILLDSLKEPAKRGVYKELESCELGEAQKKWLEETLPVLTKPTFVCAHHTAGALKIDRMCAKAPMVVGYLHGHHHTWMTNYIFSGYSDHAKEIRMMGFPSFGLDRDVGWGLVRTTPERAVVCCRSKDHFFPLRKSGAERPATWDSFVRDWNGRKIVFEFDCVQRNS